MEKVYNVILHKGVDYAKFHQDMITITNLDGIPNRQVESPNERPGSQRQTWYSLTEEEVELVKAHDDVLEVEQPPEYRDDITIINNASQTGHFDRLPNVNNDDLNWGLYRVTEVSQSWSSYGEDRTFYYTSDGEGVDIVIQDSGIEPNHPEWEDVNGVSRYRSINWATVSGLSFTQHANHDRDYDGHGTHVAGIAAGKKYGHAKSAHIYSQKVAGLEGTGDAGTGISTTYAFDAIKLWHRNKAVDPKTGYKRPTVVNMSWGYGRSFSANADIALSFRGNLTGSANASERTHAGLNVYDTTDSWLTNLRISSVDTDVDELIEEGVHVCIAAGNRNLLMTNNSSNVNYNNWVSASGVSQTYYHRGSSPFSEDAYMVGSVGPYTTSSVDFRSSFTNHGDAVDIYSVGSNIMSAMSTTHRSTFSTAYYDDNNNYLRGTLQGTSMASPQVAGVLACYLQANPGVPPADLKKSVLADGHAHMNVLLNDSGSKLSSTVSTHTNEARYLRNKFVSSDSSFDKPITITNISSLFGVKI